MAGHIQPEEKQLAEIMRLPNDQPVVMINLLRYRERTEDEKQTGKERYLEYSKKAMPFLKNSGGEIIYIGLAFPTIIGPQSEAWDHVALVRYPSTTHFLKMIQSKGYPHYIRSAALADSRLIPSMGTMDADQ